MRKLKNLSGTKLIVFCAVFLTVIWSGKNLFAFGYETFARSTGKMETVTLSADDFQLIGVVKTDEGKYITTDGDPQLVLEQQMKISRITINSTFSVAPGEMVVYYAEKPGQPYSAAKRYWFYTDAASGNGYTASMPIKNLASIRIDPTTVAGNSMEIESIVLNSPKSFIEFFAVDFRTVFNLLVYSAIIATVITLIKETFSGFSFKGFKK